MEKVIDAIKKQRAEMGLIINPLINNYKLEDKEILEVCQVGKFLYKINPELRIADKPKPPNPDFIFKVDNKIIGLEHTRIVDPTRSQIFFSISNLFDSAAKEYNVNYPSNYISATFRLKNDKLEFRQQDKKQLIKKINSFVNDAIKGNYDNQPDFIKRIAIVPNSIVSFSYLEDSFSVEKLTIEDLKSAISIKETKLKKYYQQSSLINEFWLVLMVGSLNSASFELDENTNYKTASIFDKVFLMSDFSEEIVEIK